MKDKAVFGLYVTAIPLAAGRRPLMDLRPRDDIARRIDADARVARLEAGKEN